VRCAVAPSLSRRQEQPARLDAIRNCWPEGARRLLETPAVPLPLGADGNIVHLAITHDVTANRVAEETSAAQQLQLIHMSRIFSTGKMLAAITNLAAVYTILADQSSSDLTKLREHMASILAKSARAGPILGQLQNLVKHSEDNRIDSDLIQLLADSLTLVRANLRSRHVTVDTNFPVQSVIATVAPVQFQPNIVNLISNACHALESQPPDKRKPWSNITEKGDPILIRIIDSEPRLLIDAAVPFSDLLCTSTASGIAIGLTICSDII